MKKKYSPVDFRSFFKLLMISSFFFLISSCSDNSSSEEVVFSNDYICPTCKTSPEALAENDNSSKGIYIGISDKGILYINIDNNSFFMGNLGKYKHSSAIIELQISEKSAINGSI